MCGLVGMAGYLEHKHKQVMTDLLFLDSLRGMDSTGLSCVKRNREVLTRKMTVPGYEFIQIPVVMNAMTFGDQLWMGHNRFKTTGSVNRANAHPFEVLDDEGDILLVGAHNGTLNNKWDIEKELKGDKFDTDSEALFNLIVEKGNVKDAIKLTKGAWSLTFWDPLTNTINFLRNKERPMTYAFTKDRKVIMWASEAWMLVNAARRQGVELEKNDKGLSCYSTNPDMLYSLEIPQERDVVLPELRKEGGFTGAPVGGFQGNGYGFGRFKQWWDEDEQEGPRSAAQTKEKGKADGEEEKKVYYIGKPNANEMRGYQGEVLSLAAFAKIKEKGCVWCGEHFENDQSYAFLTEDSLVCLQCVYDKHPKDGDRVRSENGDEEFLDDDLPFDLKGKPQEGTPEYARVMAQASEQAAKMLG